MIRFELLDNCCEQIWDNVVAGFEEGTIFHTMAWMQVVEKLYGAEKLPMGIFDGSDLLGVFPFFCIRRGPIKILGSPLGGVGYGGPLIRKTFYRAVIEQVDGLLKHLGTGYIGFRSLAPLSPKTLTDNHYGIQELKTIILPLNQKSQQLWDNLKSECRTAIRKARKNNVRIIEATNKNFLDVYYEMAKDTYKKSNRLPPLSKSAYSVIWDLLKPYDRIRVMLAKHDDQVVAGGIFFHFNNRLYYWDGASFPDYYSLCPNNLLHWSLIEWGANNGVTQYDMLGANIPSIAKFKLSFGGDLRTYTYAYKDATLPAYIGRRLYQFLIPQIRRVQYRFRHT